MKVVHFNYRSLSERDLQVIEVCMRAVPAQQDKAVGWLSPVPGELRMDVLVAHLVVEAASGVRCPLTTVLHTKKPPPPLSVTGKK